MRHFRGLLARNVLPPRPVIDFRKVALYYVLSEVISEGDEGANPELGNVLYTSEKAFATLNPEWYALEG